MFPTSFDESTRSNIKDFEHSQRAKPLKALIGMGILIAIVLALWEFNPNRSDTANTATSISTDTNRAPGQTTGIAPSRPAPAPSAK
ncbi:hypothetical protein [Afipia sp. Root123D2]|uniref:hypothetical protein n=1 Tax=Afipia sp. Root123D2 TaxID=1736436 RepID=UPI0012E8CE10|nr:hypothetical protein [Afipia sp. Root123D2]